MTNFKWPSEDEHLRKHIKISAKKKMEWLHEIHKFTVKASSKRDRLIHWKLRNIL